MTTYFVSRHAGSLAWIAGKLPQPQHVTHLDVAAVRRGDVVAGTLPVHLAAEVCRRGGRFYHLALDTRPDERGAELSAEALEARGAGLVRYEVREVAEDGRWRRFSTKAAMAAGRLGGADLVFLGVLATVVLVMMEVALVKAAGITAAVALAVVVGLAVALFVCGRRFLFGIFVVSGLVLAQAGLFELVKTVVVAVAVVNEAGGLTDVVWRAPAGERLLFAGAVFCVVVALGYIVYKWRHTLIHTAVRRSDRIAAKPVLIMGLSDLAGEGGRNLVSNLKSLETARSLPLSALALTEDEVKDEKRPLSEDDRGKLTAIARFPWQQNLRAMKPHLGVLRHLIVITSHQSHDNFPDFRSWIDDLRMEIGPLKVHEVGPADFEDYDDLVQAFGSALRLSGDECGARLEEVCLDATAGLKIFSMTAAIVTLNKSLVFTYVNNRGKVRAYDASVALGEFS